MTSTPMPYTIRDAARDDLPAIVAIYNASVPGRLATADTEPVTVASREAWFAEHAQGAYPLWVAETEGVVAGWFSFRPFYGRPAYRQTAEISVYVATDWQRKGVGAVLLEEALRRSPALGLRNLVAFVFGHNTASLALMEHYDFERWGLLPGIAELDGVRRDLVILGRPITAS